MRLPSAFPVNELGQSTGDVVTQHFGLTIRDYFAAAALQGLLASDDRRGSRAIAEHAYDLANAMLAELTKHMS